MHTEFWWLNLLEKECLEDKKDMLDNIKMNAGDTGSEDCSWVGLAHDDFQLWSFVLALLNLRVLLDVPKRFIAYRINTKLINLRKHKTTCLSTAMPLIA
jgi:hypothetical protein